MFHPMTSVLAAARRSTRSRGQSDKEQRVYEKQHRSPVKRPLAVVH